MKLTITRNSKVDVSNSDRQRMHTIRIRLRQASEGVRSVKLAEEQNNQLLDVPKPRTDDVATPAPVKLPSTNLRVKITRPAGKNLTLNLAKGAGRPTAKGSELSTQVSEEVLWKARRMHGRHLPVLQCNNCSISRVCPKFKAGYECAYLPYLNSHRVESTEDLLKYMKLMVGNSMKRAQLMSLIETSNGGMPSVETSEALDMSFRQLKELHGVMTESGEESIEIEGDATIVGSIFGGMKLEKIIEETQEMKRADPMLSLPDVPLAADDIQSLPSADVSEELIRDALLGATGNIKPKKDLHTQPVASIAQSDLNN